MNIEFLNTSLFRNSDSTDEEEPNDFAKSNGNALAILF